MTRTLKRKPKQTGRQRRVVTTGLQGAYNYRAQRSDLETNTGRNTKRRLKRPDVKNLGNFWIQRIGGLVLLVSGILFTISTLNVSTNARVISLATKQAPFLQSESVYQKAASEALGSSFWNHSKITINTAGVREKLLKQFPELADVSITLPLLASRPVVYIEPAEPAVILASAGGSFVLDTNGRALLASSALTPNSGLSLPLVTDQSGLDVRLNQQALTSKDVTFIRTVVVELKAANMPIESLTLPVTTRELDVRLVGQPYTIKFNLASDTSRQQSGTFLATINRLQSKGITPGKYIDVRVDGRAYYQ
jgi:hypothetical protein